MLINFSVENFRSIKNKVTLSFEASNSNDLEDYFVINAGKDLRLLKLGLIYGANASGKTTLLNSLDFLQELILEPADKKNEIIEFSPFLFDKESKNKNTIFNIEFFQNNVKYIYNLELNKKSVIAEELYFHKPNKALVFRRTTEVSKQLSKIEFGSKIKINKSHKSTLEANTLWNNTVLGGYIKTNFESKELQETIDWFDNKLKPLISSKTSLLNFISSRIESDKINKNDIVEFLKKADFNISDLIIKSEETEIDADILEFLNKKTLMPDDKLNKIKETGKIEKKEIFFQHSLNNDNFLLPYNDESEGTQRYYQFSGLLSLMMKNELIVPIDEIESSLHPDLLKHFLLSFLVNSKTSQLIATTHHRELLIEKDILRSDAIWFAEKNDNGCTELYSLDDFDSSVVRKDTGSIFNAYKTGKLGAVPSLSDYYIELENG
ncbi:ATP-binding protein [Polaribacter staleyi]|uniref:AAA family ATPase n=1 Tax=Polaribacter staleyi TaxID=2022337 RepID=UPI0031BBCD97